MTPREDSERDSFNRPSTGSESAAEAGPGRESGDRGYGEAANGMVRVSLDSNGIIEMLEFDPRALRLGSTALAAEARRAVRDVQRRWFARLGDAEGTADKDVQEFNNKADDIHAAYARQINEYHTLMDQILRDSKE